MANSNRGRPKHPFSHVTELFDASALGLVTLLLLIASFFATWRGMGDFIASREIAAGTGPKALVLLIVATLSLAMYVALREMISPYYVRGWWSAIWKRFVAFLLYAVLALWSVGFGYGFWWSLVAGQSATEAALERTVSAVGEETSDVRARLAAASSVMDSAEQLSDLKAEQEATRGGTCGVSSPPGDGPLARARSETQAQIAALASTVRDDWQGPMVARLTGLETNLQTAIGGGVDEASRKATFEALARDTQTAARDIGSDATARGRTLAAQLRSKADQLSAPPEGGRVAYCYDPDLAASLNAAADELAQTYDIVIPAFSFAEGPDGVARAIEQLAESVMVTAGVAEARPSTPLEGRELIALLAAIGVDLALFVFALLRGSSGRGGDMAPDEPPLEGGREMIEAAPELPPIQDTSPAARGLADQRPTQRAETPSNDEPDFIEAEFVEPETAVSVIRTYDPRDNQLEHDEQVEELLDRVRSHMEAIHSAKGSLDKSRMQGHLSQALRELERIGYRQTGMTDEIYKPRLHMALGEQSSRTVPSGQILRILRPRFVDREGVTLIPALVILSTGPEG